MKLRQGFVSNSSSSSFILNLKGVATSKDLEKMLNWELFKDYAESNYEVLDFTWDDDPFYKAYLSTVTKKAIADMLFKIIEGYRKGLHKLTTYTGKVIETKEQLFYNMFWEDNDFSTYEQAKEDLNTENDSDVDFLTIGNDAEYPCELTPEEFYFLYKFEYVVPRLFEGLEVKEQDQH